MEFDIFGLVVLPLLIFGARFADVTLMTMRIIFTSQGKYKIAPLVGFVEVFIWLVAMSQVFSNLTNVWYYIAYSAGFAAGTWTGMYLERKLKLGLYNLQVITKVEPVVLIKELKERGYGVTVMVAEGVDGRKSFINIIIKKKNFTHVSHILEEICPDAFVSVSNVHSVKGGILPPTLRSQRGKRG